MMSPTINHIIKSQVFNTSFFSKEEAPRFQRVFSDLIQLKLDGITEDCLKAYDRYNRQLSIDRLEIDLKDIRFEKLDTELPEKYEGALKKALSQHFGHLTVDKTHEHSPDIEGGEIPTILYFLLKGYMPWQYDQQHWHSFDNFFQYVLGKHSGALLEALSTVMADNKVKLRLIANLELRTISQLIRKVEPAEAALILAYHHDWLSIHKKKNVFKGYEREISQRLWLFILKYLYDERGSYFNTKSFLISTLRQMSLQYNLAFDLIINLLKDSYRELSQLSTGSTFNILIKDIISTFKRNESAVQTANQRKEEHPDLKLLSGLKTFAQGAMWGAAGGEGFPSLKAAISRLFNEKPQSLLTLLNQLGQDEWAVYRLISPLDEQRIHKLITILEPSGAPVIIHYHQDLVQEQDKRSFISGPARNFPKVLWALMIVILLDNQGSAFNQRAFAARLIRRMANRYNLTYSDLLKTLYTRLHTQPVKSKQVRLFSIISALYKEEFKAEKTTESIEALVSQREILIAVTKGVLPGAIARLGFNSLKHFLIDYATKSPRLFRHMLEVNSGDMRFYQQVIYLLGRDLLKFLGHSSESQAHWHFLYFNASETPIPHLSHAENYHVAARQLAVLMVVHQAGCQKKIIHQYLLIFSREQGIELDSFLTFLILVSRQGKHLRLISVLQSFALDYNLNISQSDGPLTKASAKRMVKGEHAIQPIVLSEMVDMIVMAFSGITDALSMAKLGYGSISEMLGFLIKSTPDRLLSYLLPHLQTVEVLSGIGREIPRDLLYALLRLIFPNKGETLISFLKDLNHICNASHQTKRLVYGTYGILFRLFSQKSLDVEAFIKAFIQLLFKSGPSVYLPVVAALTKEKELIKLPASGGRDDMFQALASQLDATQMVRSGLDGDVLKKVLMKRYFDAPSPVKTPGTSPYLKFVEPETEEYYLDNAGLVLLNAFYPRLFDRLDLLDEDKKLKPSHRVSAAIILQHVLMRNPPLDEESMVLNKIMVGLEPEELIEPGIYPKPTPEAITEIEEMIKAAAGYWKGIGATSVDGFRGNWLCRPGKLERGENFWDLRVEKAAHDVLLEHLPFSISPMRYSWMSKPVNVFWR